MSTLRVNTITPQSGSTNQLSGSVLITNALTVNGASAFVNATFTQLLTGTTFSGSAATFSGNVTAATLTGTLQTATQTNITSVGTLSSLTVSGDLLVDSSTLYVKSSTNQVGVGTTGFTTGAIFQVKTATDRNLSVRDVSSELSLEAVNDGSSANIPLRYYASTHKWFAGANPMTFDASGNLGLGVTPSAWDSGLKAFQFGSTSALTDGSSQSTVWHNTFVDSGGNPKYLTTAAAAFYRLTGGQHIWYNAASGTAGNTISFTQAMTLDASGNLGVGTTSPNLSGGSAGSQVVTVSATSSGRNGILELNGTRTTSGDYVGYVRFYNNAGATPLADIQAIRGSSDTTGVLAFATGNTEHARITAGGYFRADDAGAYTGITVAHGFRSSAAGTLALVCTHASNPFGLDMSYSAASPNGTSNEFIYLADSTALRASIRSNGGLANYQANDVNLSDERVKTDIKPAGSYWNKFKAIEIVTFKYKDQTHDDDNIGVIAQQVEAVAPEFIDVDGFGETPEDGEPLKTVYTTDLYHAAIKALQEAMARIEALEARLEALEA